MSRKHQREEKGEEGTARRFYLGLCWLFICTLVCFVGRGTKAVKRAECTICFIPYHHSNHLPLVMPCGHTVCSLAVPKLNPFRCPTCRAALPADCRLHVKKFPTNYALLADTDTDTDMDMDTDMRPSVDCSEHRDQELVLFCKDCNIPLCALCVVGTHRGHTLIDLKTACDTASATIGEMVAALTVQERTLQAQHHTIDVALTELKNNTQQVEDRINSTFQQYHQDLDRQQAKATNRLDFIHNAEQARLDRERQSTTARLQALQELLQVTGDLRVRNPAEYLIKVSQLASAVSTWSEPEPVIAVPIVCCIKPLSTDATVLKQTTNPILNIKTPREVHRMTSLEAQPNLTQIKFRECPTGLSDALMTLTSQRCSQLTHLDLGGCQNLSDVGIIALLKRCLQLTTFKANHNEAVNDLSLLAVAQCCPQLQQLQIPSCRSVSEVSFVQITLRCPQLHSVDVRECTSLSGAALATLGKCPLLHTVNVSDNPNVTDATVVALTNGCPQLSHLQMNKTRISQATVFTLLQKATNLMELSLDHTLLMQASTAVTSLTHQLPKLTLLSLQFTEIADQTLISLFLNCPNLVTLDLEDCETITHVSMMTLAQQCPKLSHLQLRGCVFDPQAYDALASAFPLLTDLNLDSHPKLNDDALIQFATHCPNLKSLNVSHCTLLTNASITLVFSHCVHLTLVSVAGCATLTDLSMLTMANHCHELTEICISQCESITDAGILEIAEHYPRLTRLYASNLPLITDASISVLLHKCPLLTELGVTRCSQITPTMLQQIDEQLSGM